MKYLKIFLYYIVLTAFTLSCSKDEYKPFDQPFVHIHVNNASTIQVQANRNQVVNYNIYLSAKLQYEPTQVYFEVIAGNGLTEGTDYELVTTGKTLTFAPGVFEMPVTIRWKSNPLDTTKNNILTIRITGNDRDFTVGLPGPDKNQSALIIQKI